MVRVPSLLHLLSQNVVPPGDLGVTMEADLARVENELQASLFNSPLRAHSHTPLGRRQAKLKTATNKR